MTMPTSLAQTIVAMVVIVIVVGVLLVRERRAVRRSGMSDANPVCARCHYPLGGWSTPKCPECGQDCQARPVRVRVATRRPIRYGLIVLALLIGAPVAFRVCSSRFQNEIRMNSIIFGTHGAVGWRLRLQIDETWRSPDAPPTRAYRLTLAGDRVAASSVIETDDPADQTFDRRLDDAITAVVGATAPDDPEAIADARTAITTLLARAHAVESTFDVPIGVHIEPPALLEHHGESYATGQRRSAMAYVGWGASVLVMLVLCVVAARLVGHRGVRPVRDGEWVQAGRASDGGTNGR